jgi:hypothetical protein
MSADHSPSGGPPGRGRDFLLPVLPAGPGPADPVAVATWHLAVSDAMGAELPHDLLALWLFPEAGGVVLLGPASLAADRVQLARPTAFLGQEQLLALEDRVRLAGYASVIASPIRDQHRDLGLMLLAALAAGRFGPIQAIRLFEILRHFAPPFRELSERVLSAPGEVTLPRATDPDLLLATVARTASEARSGAELVTRLSAALQDLLPHDSLEIVVRDGLPGGPGWESLGRPRSVRRWGAASGREGDGARLRSMDALEERIGGQGTLVVADVVADRGGLGWPARAEDHDGPRIHAMLALALPDQGERLGYVLLGSAATDLYRPADEAMLIPLAEVISGWVAAVSARREVEHLRRTVAALEGPGGAIARAVRLLAATPHFGAATQGVATILRELTGCTNCRFILRFGAGEAVEVKPGEARPLLDLPLVPVQGATFATVLSGETPLLLLPSGEDEELVLPLRLAGRPVGVMILTGPGGGRLASVTLAAQQVADTLAPHLELVRREAGVEARSER